MAMTLECRDAFLKKSSYTEVFLAAWSKGMWEMFSLRLPPNFLSDGDKNYKS